MGTSLEPRPAPHLHPTKPSRHLIELPIFIEEGDQELLVRKEKRVLQLLQAEVDVPAFGRDQPVDIIATFQKVPDLWIQQSLYMGRW